MRGREGGRGEEGGKGGEGGGRMRELVKGQG